MNRPRVTDEPKPETSFDGALKVAVERLIRGDCAEVKIVKARGEIHVFTTNKRKFKVQT